MKNFSRLTVGVLVLALVWLATVSQAFAKEKPPTGAVGLEAGPAGAAVSCPNTFGPLITDTAAPVGRGVLQLQPWFSLAVTTGHFTKRWDRTGAGGDYLSFIGQLQIWYGFTDTFFTEINIDYVQNWASRVDQPGPGGERAATFSGIGNTDLFLKLQLCPEGMHRPVITGIAAVTFPTAPHSRLNPAKLGTDNLGEGGYRFLLGFNASKCARPFIYYGNLWYSVSTRAIQNRQAIQPPDRIILNLAMEYPFVWGGPWVALAEFYSKWDVGPVLTDSFNTTRKALLGVLLGLEYIYSDKIEFALGVSMDLAGKNTNQNVTPIFSMIFTF